MYFLIANLQQFIWQRVVLADFRYDVRLKNQIVRRIVFGYTHDQNFSFPYLFSLFM